MMRNSIGGASFIGSDSSQSSESIASESASSFQVKARTEFLSFLYIVQNSSRKHGSRTFGMALALYILMFWSFIWMPLLSPQHFNFGVWGSWIFTVLNYTSSLSMDLLPYDGAIALASISMVLVLISLAAFVLTVRAVRTTSKFIPYIKRLLHVCLFATLLLSAPMTYILTSFVDCDYGYTTNNLIQQQGSSTVAVSAFANNSTTQSTMNLNRFDTVQCLETKNIVMMIVSLIGIVILQFEAILTVLVLPNSHPLSNTPMIGDSVILPLLGVICNILGMLVHFLIPANFAFVRSIFHLVTSFTLLVLLFKLFPMMRRFENSIVAGVISARVGASIGGLVTSLANPSNDNVLGVGLTMMTLALVVLLGILGGVIAEIYSRVIVKKLRKKFVTAIQDKNIEREALNIYQQLEDDNNLSKMDMYMRFTMGVEVRLKDEEENADLMFIISFIRAISSQKSFSDQNILNSSACIAAYFMGEEMNASTFAHALIKKALKQRPNLYMRFILGQRLKEIETATSEGVRGQKNAIDLKSTFAKIEKSMLEITSLHRHFWKELMQEIVNFEKVENISSRNAVLIEECDNMFTSLLALYYNDKTVMRMYANYLENIKFNRELAGEYFNEAMSLEEDEGNFQKRGAAFKAKLARKNRVHPDSNSVGTIETIDNSKRLIQASVNAINLSVEHPPSYSQFNYETMSSIEESIDNFNGIENTVSGEQKREMIFRNALTVPASRNIQIGVFIGFAGLGFAFLIAGLVIALNFSDVVTLNVINVIDACSPIAALSNILVTVRAYQSTVHYMNTTSSSVRKTMTSEMFLDPTLLKQNIQNLRTILVNLQQKAYDAKFNPAVYSHYHEFYYPFYVPLMQSNPTMETKFYNETLSENVTITDITNVLVKLSDQMINGDNAQLLNSMNNYGFMLMYRNQETVTYAYQKFCRVFTDTAKEDALRINNIFTIYTSVALAVYVVYALIYIVYSRFELSTMKKQIKLIHDHVSKNEVGKLFHDLGKKVGDEVSIHISKTSVLKPKNIFIVVGLFVMVMVSISLGIFLKETLGNSKYSFESYITMEDGFDALAFLQRLSFSVAEQFYYESTNILNQKGLNEIPILSKAETKTLKQNFDGIVFQLRYFWNLCMYGSAVKAYETLVVGMFPETDQMIRGDLNCTIESVSNNYNKQVLSIGYKPKNYTQCDFGIDYMVQDTILKASRIIEDLVATSKTSNHDDLLSIMEEFYSVAFLANTVSFKLIDFSLIFAVKSSTPMVTEMTALSIVGFSINLIGCVVMYYFLTLHWKNVFSLRSLFNYISIETFENNEQLRNYALYHTLSDGALSRLFVKKRNVGGEDAKVRNILNAAVDGVVLCNSSSCIDIFNPAAQRMFGNQQEDVIGKLLFTLLCPQHHEEIRKAVDSMKQTVTEFDPKGESFDVECIRKNQTTFPAKMNIFVTLFEKKPIITCFIKDITSEKKHNALLAEEKKNSETLLLNILPGAVAAKLKNGTSLIAEKFADITCFFSDMVGFTSLSSKLAPNELVQMLNQIVMGFDDLTDRYHLEKIKTIGDAYFAAGGLHDLNAQSDHPERVLKFAIDTFSVIRSYNSNFRKGRFDEQINIRIGINTGPVVAGVIGRKKFAYDLWGDSINTASRMESNSKPGRVQVSRSTYERVYDLGFTFEERMIEVKGKGTTQTYLLSAKHHESAVLTAEELTPTNVDNFIGEDVSSEHQPEDDEPLH